MAALFCTQGRPYKDSWRALITRNFLARLGTDFASLARAAIMLFAMISFTWALSGRDWKRGDSFDARPVSDSEFSWRDIVSIGPITVGV